MESITGIRQRAFPVVVIGVGIKNSLIKYPSLRRWVAIAYLLDHRWAAHYSPQWLRCRAFSGLGRSPGVSSLRC